MYIRTCLIIRVKKLVGQKVGVYSDLFGYFGWGYTPSFGDPWCKSVNSFSGRGGGRGSENHPWQVESQMPVQGADSEAPEAVAAMAKDINKRHRSFLAGDGVSSFRPKKLYRTSVKKVVSMLGNQVPDTAHVIRCMHGQCDVCVPCFDW